MTKEKKQITLMNQKAVKQIASFCRDAEGCAECPFAIKREDERKLMRMGDFCKLSGMPFEWKV